MLNFTLIPQRQYYMREMWSSNVNTTWDLRGSRASRRRESSHAVYLIYIYIYIKTCYLCFFAWSAPIDQWMTLIKVCQSKIALISCDIWVLPSVPQGPLSIHVICIASNQCLHVNGFIRGTWPWLNRLHGNASCSLIAASWLIRNQGNLIISA